jgi:Protein of unknown function (DUF3485)
MATVSLLPKPKVDAPVETADLGGSDHRASRSPWVWMTITCVLLVLSGGVRLWREWGFAALAVESAACPFALSDLPRKMGDWMPTDAEAQLDPEVARYAGATDHILRNYIDPNTGDLASALVLYGPGASVHGHVPEICYPEAGYQFFKGPIDGKIEVPGIKDPVQYRWAIYSRRVGGVTQHEEVYHTFYHNGEWIPEAGSRWKEFRYHPGLYKIQVAHPVFGLAEDGNGPGKPLLIEFVKALNERIVAAKGSETKPAAGAAAAPTTAAR